MNDTATARCFQCSIVWKCGEKLLRRFLRGPTACAGLALSLQFLEILRAAFRDLLAPFPTQRDRRRVFLSGQGLPSMDDRDSRRDYNGDSN